MKAITLKIFALTATLALFSCGNNKAEDAENAKESEVGNIYNKEEQGVQHENRDNQFNESRNDNVEGTGLETGAPTDTIDRDGDKKVQQP
jgi:hypothetical protein